MSMEGFHEVKILSLFTIDIHMKIDFTLRVKHLGGGVSCTKGLVPSLFVGLGP